MERGGTSERERSSRRVALLDWDGSLHRGLTLRSWTHHLHERELLPDDIAGAMEERFSAYEEGDLPYRRLAKETPELYARGLEGVGQEELRAHARSYVDGDRRNVFPFARALLESLVERGIETVVISGSPVETLSLHKQLLPIDRHWGIVVAVRDGRFTGDLELNPAEQAAKERIVSAAAEGARVALAIGDSEADLPMLDLAEARIVVDNDALLPDDQATLHLAPEATDDGGLAALRAFVAGALDD
ncbi:MAG: haloacid dehalogenase-like hydrolase [Actinomycetota bacterium]|nr:haloacid dehalogenase-like hydrolase [Actinomycetota bacterium]